MKPKRKTMKWLDNYPELWQSLEPVSSNVEREYYPFDCIGCPCFSPDCVIELDCPSDCPGLPYRRVHRLTDQQK